MSNLAFNIINECFNKTKKRLFPFNLKEWLKLGFVNMLGGNYISSGSSSATSGSSNYSIPESVSGNLTSITGLATASPSSLAFLIPLLILFPIGAVILAVYLNALFYFVLIDSVMKQKTEINKSIKSVKNQAMSLFKFRIVLFIIIAALFILLFLIPVVSLSVAGIIGLALSGLLFILLFIGLILLIFVVNIIVDNILVPISYFKKNDLTSVWKSVKKKLKKNWVDFVLYGIISLIIDFIIISALGVILAVLLIPIILLLTPLILAELIWLVIPISVILFLIILYLIHVIILPLSVFKINYITSFLKKSKLNI